MKTAARVLAALLPFTLGACGSEGSGSSDPNVYDSVPEEEAPRTFAHELCFLMMQRCDCSIQPFDSMAQCVDLMSQQMEMDFAEARAAGLEYHPECMAEYINLYTLDLGCSTFTDLVEGQVAINGTPSCKVHAGTGQEGDMCEQYPVALGDDCAQGLTCFGTCQVTPSYTAKDEGEACDPLLDVCPLGAACLDGVCERLPGEGEPCTIGCDVGLSCERDEEATGTDRTCVGPPGLGEPCSFARECAEGSYCSEDVCVATLAPGEPCGNGYDEACGPGYVCDEPADSNEDVCMPEEAFVCI